MTFHPAVMEARSTITLMTQHPGPTAMGVRVRLIVLMTMTMITLMVMLVPGLDQTRFMGALLIAFPGCTIILGHDGQARRRYHP